MSRYDKNYEDENYDCDIRNKVPIIMKTIRIESEDGDKKKIDIEINPKLLEIVNSQTYEKNDNSMGNETEHTLEGEIDVKGNTYFVEMRVSEYPINAVDDYEVIKIEKM